MTLQLELISTKHRLPTKTDLYLVCAIGYKPYRLLYCKGRWIDPIHNINAKTPDYWAELPIIQKGGAE